MGIEEQPVTIGDHATVQLVEAPPPEDVTPDVPLPEPPESSPQDCAREATISQTGADPPPAVRG